MSSAKAALAASPTMCAAPTIPGITPPNPRHPAQARRNKNGPEGPYLTP
jgi:hypothetical protein